MKKWCLRIFIWRYKGICLRILHVCGGDPQTETVVPVANEYSPRMWR